MSKYLLLTVSAFLYALPFLLSHYFWWLIFFFPIPLFIAALTYKLSFREGFYWLGLAFVAHSGGAMFSTIQSGVGSYATRFLPFGIVSIYYGLVGALFFLLFHQVELQIGKTIFSRLFIWIFGIWLLFVFIDVCSFYPLWLFERFEGYFLMLPLLPLAHYAYVLLLLPYVGKFGLLFLFFLPSAFYASWWVTKSTKWIVASLVSCIPWFVSLGMVSAELGKPVWLDEILCLQKKLKNSPNLLTITSSIVQDFREIIVQNPKIKLIIIPESACTLAELSEEPILTQCWHKNFLGKELHLVMGGCREADEKYYNSVHWFCNEKLCGLADKRHVMLLTERLPEIFEQSSLHEAYLGATRSFDVAALPRTKFNIFSDQSFIPYICSELFFTQYPDDEYGHTTILALCGDAWARHSYIGTLMFLMARLRSIEWQRDIVYCSYRHAAFLTSRGTMYCIKTKC